MLEFKSRHNSLRAVMALPIALLLMLVFIMPAFAFQEEQDGPADSDFLESPVKRKSRVFRAPSQSKRPGGMAKQVFKPYTDELESYFRPMSANIVSIKGGVIVSDIAPSSDVPEGMRFNVMKQGGIFVHPVTGQTVAGSETLAAVASVTIAGGEGAARLELVSGTASAGDVLRIPSAQVKVMFYQDAALDWDVSEEYYFWLGDSGRFTFIDAASDWGDEDKLLFAARASDAEILVMLSPVQSVNADEVTLRQRVVWVSDGQELRDVEIVVDAETLKALKLSGEMFSPRDKSKPVFIFDLPTRGMLLANADMDCDGKDELVVSSGSSMSVFSVGIDIVPAFGMDEPLEIAGPVGRRHVWLEAADLDRDGCDEILVSTVKNNNEIRSYIYDYKAGIVSVLWEGDVFVRVIDGAVYAQKPAHMGGYEGGVYLLDAAMNKGNANRGDIMLPEGINIYDFTRLPFSDGMLVWQRDGHLALHSGSALDKTWVSEDSYGGAFLHFNWVKDTEVPEDSRLNHWYVSDRFVLNEGAVYAPYRVRFSDRAVGFGFSGSGIIRITGTGTGALNEQVFVRDIRNAVTGFAFSDDRMYLVRNSLSTNWGSFITGKGLFVSKLYVYMTEGL